MSALGYWGPSTTDGGGATMWPYLIQAIAMPNGRLRIIEPAELAASHPDGIDMMFFVPSLHDRTPRRLSPAEVRSFVSALPREPFDDPTAGMPSIP